MRRSTCAAIALTLLAAGCAQPPGSIAPVAVSARDYEDLSCAELSHRINETARELDRAEARQRNHVAGDAAGVFFILIPPSAFTGDASDEVAMAKGEDIALRRAFEKECVG